MLICSNVDKLEKVSSKLNNLKSKLYKLDVHKFPSVSVDLSKLSNEVNNDVIKIDVYNADKKGLDKKKIEYVVKKDP